MSNTMIISAIVIGVVAMGAAIAYGTANQQNYIPEDAVLQSQAGEGILEKTGGLGADLNKEQWYEDPYADEAAKVRAEWEKNNGS